MNRKISEYERKIEHLSGEVRTESSKREIMTRENSTLSQRLVEIDRLSNELSAHQKNILRLTSENQAFNTDYLNTQESLRLSTSNMSKIAAELQMQKDKIAEYENRLKRADEEIDRHKRENYNHQQRFAEIEKQTRIMGELQKQVIALAKENERLTLENQRGQ